MKSIVRLTVLIVLFISTRPGYLLAQAGWAKAYEHGVVVSAEERASQIGAKILRQGGNAIDAAVAVQFALAVTVPRAGNIGGGGFMVIHRSDGTAVTLDFREKAPGRARENMYVRNGKYKPELSRESALASGVPGVVDGMIKAIERHGRFPLETVIMPAIELAREGFPLSWKLADELNSYAESFEKYESSRSYFIRDDGNKWKEGDLFKQPDLAETLERIAHFGRSGFYSGQTADLIVNEMRRQGGIITHRDLDRYESKWREPVRAEFGGYELIMMPPPSSGSIAIHQILDMLRPHDLGEYGFNSADYVHLITEAMRRAFADRAHFMGDPDFNDIPVERLLSDSYNHERMDDFEPEKATSSEEIRHGDIAFHPGSSETTHFSVIDEDGNAVAVTTTLNSSFGNKLAVGGAGFLLNNEMDDFTAKPGEPNMYGLIQGKANAIEPGKRMLSAMTPAIVTKDGKARMILGAAGGPRIISATLQNFLNLAVFNMNAQQAVSANRFHHQWMPDRLYIEPFGLSPDTRKLLEEKGHRIQERPTVGRAHIIYIDGEGIKYGAPDPRGDGTAAGY